MQSDTKQTHLAYSLAQLTGARELLHGLSDFKHTQHCDTEGSHKKMLLTQVSAATNNICGGHNVKKRVLVRFYKMQGQLIYEALQWLLRCRGVYGLSYLLLVIIV